MLRLSTSFPGLDLLVGWSGDVREALRDRYCEAVRSAGSDGVLAWVESPTVAEWLALVRERGEARLEDRIMTAEAFARRELALWWPVVDDALTAAGWEAAEGLAGTGPSFDEPLFVQGDIAQALLWRVTSGYREEAGSFEDIRTPSPLWAVHMLDALSIGLEQGLEVPDIGERLVAGWGHPDEAERRKHVAPCIAAYRDAMLRWRMLDSGLTRWVFANYLMAATPYLRHLAKSLRILVVEGLDDWPPLWRAVLRDLAKAVPELSVIAGWRCDRGIRGAGIATPEAFMDEWLASAAPHKGEKKLTAIVSRQSGARDVGVAVSAGLGYRGSVLPGVQPGGTDADALPLRVETARTFHEMLEAAADAARVAWSAGKRVALVAPAIQPLIVWWLDCAFEKKRLPFAMSAGTHRLLDFRVVRAAVSLADLAFAGDRQETADRDEDWWFDLLEEVTSLGPHELRNLAPRLAQSPDFPGTLDPEAFGDAAPGLARLRDWLGTVRSTPQSLGGVFRLAMAHILAPAAGAISDPARSRRAWSRVGELAQLISAAERFDAVDEQIGQVWGAEGDRQGGMAGLARRFRAFLTRGQFAERAFDGVPSDGREVRLYSSSQFARERPWVDVAFWLDVSSPAWWKPDARELVNVRVLEASRPLGAYGLKEAQADGDAKLARTVLACAASVRERIHAYASVSDYEGVEQPGGLLDFLQPLGQASVVPAGVVS